MGRLLPRRDLELRSWSAGFSENLSRDPGRYGVNEAQAAAMAARQAAFDAAVNLAYDPMTRTRGNVVAKDAARAALESEIYTLVKVIRGAIGDDAAVLAELGMEPATTRRRATPPSESPVVRVVSVDGRSVRVRVLGGTPGRRSRPSGVVGANLFFCRVEEGGDSMGDEEVRWQWIGNVGGGVFEVRFDDLPPGTRVCFAASWINTRMQAGPLGKPAEAILQFGGTIRLAA